MNAPRAWPNSSLSSSVSVIAPQLIATNGPAARADSSWMSRATRSLPDAALAGDEHGRVDLGHAARQVEHLPHRRALRDDARAASSRRGATRTSARRRARSFRSAASSVSVTRLERDVEALLGRWLVEAQLLGALLAPLLARAADQVAGRVALAQAAVLEHVDLACPRSG